MNCYICQPDDPNAAGEGCESCDRAAMESRQQEWEEFRDAAHAKGLCEFSGMRVTQCQRTICDCFESPDGAAEIERRAGLR